MTFEKDRKGLNKKFRWLFDIGAVYSWREGCVVKGGIVIWHPVGLVLFVLALPVGIIQSIFTRNTIQDLVKNTFDYKYRNPNKEED